MPDTTRGAFLSGVAGAASLVAANASAANAAAANASSAANAAADSVVAVNPTGSGSSNGLRGLTYATIRTGGVDSLGIKTTAGVIDVVAASKALSWNAPATLDDLIAGRGDSNAVLKLAAMAPGTLPAGSLKNATAIEYGPAVAQPGKILCVGINYRAHAAQTGEDLPPVPELFSKYTSALNRHGGTIPVSALPAVKFDYEAELVILMGKTARNVTEATALDYVFGYTTGNDFTARELQRRTSQWLLGKSPDLFAPLGPFVVGAGLIPNPQSLTIECHVNGEVRQHANTAEMVHGCAKIISYTSQYMTLQPGDVIFTGTPQGTISGLPPDKQVWLKPGDQIETQIEKIGTLHFTLT